MTTVHPLRPAQPEPNPRSFCGVHPWPLIETLSVGAEVAACYLVQECSRAETKNGKPFLRLRLADRSGSVAGMVWEDALRWEPHCQPTSIVGVRGVVQAYDGKLQINVSRVEPLNTSADDLELLLPASRLPRERMESELDRLVASVSDKPLRKLLQRCVGKTSDLGRAYRVHPAAKKNHHAYLCGLLEHSLSVASTCHALCVHYTGQGMPLDRDLLVTGALLHDIGKVRELKGIPGGGYTDEGQLLGHIVIGIQLVGREGEKAGVPEDRLLLLQHLIASHQGKPEWDSPKVPQLVEAVLLHYADDLDAKLNQVRTLLAGVAPGEWSGYDRGLGRAFFQPPAIPLSKELEPIPAEEAAELFIDLFRV